MSVANPQGEAQGSAESSLLLRQLSKPGAPTAPGFLVPETWPGRGSNPIRGFDRMDTPGIQAGLAQQDFSLLSIEPSIRSIL